MSPSPNGRDGEAVSATARGIILIVVALVIGIFILNKSEVGGTAASVSSRAHTTTTTKSKSSKGATTTTPPSTRAPRPPAAIKVLAANGSGVAGLGSKTADRLTAAGYNSLAPTNTTSDVSTSVVEFTPGFDLEALYVAQSLGILGTSVKPATDVPVDDTKGADIIVLVGPDLDATATSNGLTTPTTAFGVTTTTSG